MFRFCQNGTHILPTPPAVHCSMNLRVSRRLLLLGLIAEPRQAIRLNKNLILQLKYLWFSLLYRVIGPIYRRQSKNQWTCSVDCYITGSKKFSGHSGRQARLGFARLECRADKRRWIPIKDSLALTLKVKRAKPETEPKNGNHKVFFRSHRCDGRILCGRGSDTHLAVRERQKARKAFLGVG